jgi:predicted metallopeptidase
MRTRKAPRPNATLLCRRIAADMAKKLPELAHVKPARVLFVSGEARRGSRATIKPLASTRVLLKGKRALYCITLRPKFFRASTPEQRVETLVHELLHISAGFDGHLHAGRRHSTLPGKKFHALLRPLVRRYLASADPGLLSGLGHHGEVVARQWLERPTGKSNRGQAYTERDLFLGPVQMITRRHLHS